MSGRQCVICYPTGEYQGHPEVGVNGRKVHPKVPDLTRARVYTNAAAAARSMAHNGGEVAMVAVALLAPKEEEK